MQHRSPLSLANKEWSQTPGWKELLTGVAPELPRSASDTEQWGQGTRLLGQWAEDAHLADGLLVGK